jgi:hypothetical protein
MLTRRVVLVSSVGALAGIRETNAQVVELTIKVEFSTDRDQVGTLSLLKQATRIAGPFRAYGRSDTQRATAHQNPTRNPTQPYGDTPTGIYAVPRAVRTGSGTSYNDHSYGPNGALVLRPVGGQAATAAANGRVGLLIHGGDAGANGKLRATHGCIRLSNSDVAALMAAIVAAGENATFNRCELTRINGTVGEPGDFSAGEDAGDPPPGIEDLLGNGSIRLP